MQPNHTATGSTITLIGIVDAFHIRNGLKPLA
jgi:hypothetical protein